MKKVVGTAMLVLAVAGSLPAWSGCASQDQKTRHPQAEMNDSLYQRLGGHDGVARIANGWVDRVVADQRLQQRFQGANVDTFKRRLTNQLGELSGGPEVYMGKDMKTAHRGMAISDAEWTAFMDDLRTTLADQNIPAASREELLVKLEPMRRDIIGQ